MSALLKQHPPHEYPEIDLLVIHVLDASEGATVHAVSDQWRIGTDGSVGRDTLKPGRHLLKGGDRLGLRHTGLRFWIIPFMTCYLWVISNPYLGPDILRQIPVIHAFLLTHNVILITF